MTFAKIAETALSMGHREHAARTIASAEKGYSDMLRYLSQATGMTVEAARECRNNLVSFVSDWTGCSDSCERRNWKKQEQRDTTPNHGPVASPGERNPGYSASYFPVQKWRL